MTSLRRKNARRFFMDCFTSLSVRITAHAKKETPTGEVDPRRLRGSHSGRRGTIYHRTAQPSSVPDRTQPASGKGVLCHVFTNRKQYGYYTSGERNLSTVVGLGDGNGGSKPRPTNKIGALGQKNNPPNGGLERYQARIGCPHCGREMTLDYCFFCHDKKHFLETPENSV